MEKKKSIFSLMKPYRGLILPLLAFTLFANAINLWVPQIIGKGIDSFKRGTYDPGTILMEFCIAVMAVFLFSFLQGILQTYASEKVARDLRTQVVDKISRQSYAFIQDANPSKLLTNLTADIDAIKLFISQAIASIISSICIIVGASFFMLKINWQLGLCVIAIIPIIGGTFFFVLKKVRVLFRQSMGVIDWLNKVINESILGAALIRVVNSQHYEYTKFLEANTKAKDYGLSILKMFATLIPTIIFTANMAALAILALGGHFVISGTMTMGVFAAFSSYLSQLIFPIILIGFMSNVIAQATASFDRVNMVLSAVDPVETGTITKALEGAVEVKEVNLTFGQKPVLKNISFHVQPGSKVAVIGPTAAGKTQLLYLLTGLIRPASGEIRYDGHAIAEYNSEAFHNQLGLVFQDSIIFNMSIRENIAFNDKVTDESLSKAIETAELQDFIGTLPEGLSTVVSERGSSLSGGQKQRIMLARALALNPKVLLLDDFTARVDAHTEAKILQNIHKNYPGLTLISVTQKISTVEGYDQIILLMQGEVIAGGRHEALMQSSPEYVQLYNSQLSTRNYEL